MFLLILAYQTVRQKFAKQSFRLPTVIKFKRGSWYIFYVGLLDFCQYTGSLFSYDNNFYNLCNVLSRLADTNLWINIA